MASYTVTTYHPVSSAAHDVTICDSKLYAEFGAGVLYRDLAAQRCYEETIYTIVPHDMDSLPTFPYHRDPVASGSIQETDAVCECCGRARGALYTGVAYAAAAPKALCPWCIADGSAAEKYDACFFDAYFCDEEMKEVKMPAEVHREVFSLTIGFSTFNPIGWWVHCGEPAEYVSRIEPYDMIFECRKCHKQQIIQDFD